MKKLISILLFLISFSFVHAQCSTEVQVDTVSVLPNGDVIIGWEPSPDAGILSYDIYSLNPLTGANDSIDATNTTTFFYVIPFDTIQKYQITQIGVVANCGVGIGISPLTFFYNTIKLNQQIDICNASVNLTWNAYTDFASGVNVLYHVFVSVNGGGFLFVGSTNSLSYKYEGLVVGTNYQFFVRAEENNGGGPFTTSSNLVDVSGNFLKNPTFLYLYTASVQDSSNIMVQFYVDTAADIRNYNIKRALSSDMSYSVVGSVNDYNGMDPLLEFFDEEVDAKNNSYVYQIEAVNQCNQTKITSNIGKTVQLSATPDKLSSTNKLDWNYYEGWKGNVSEYQIYRQSKNDVNYNLIATIPASFTQNTFTDNVANEIQGTGEYCYKILAVEKNTIHIDNLPTATSYSNEICVKHEPSLYIANAFEPLSEFNSTFKPSAILFELSTYLFVIYDRWGQKVFETTDREVGWNGKFNNSGNNLPMGAYVYVVQFKSNNDEEFQKRGTVTLIR